MSDTEFMRRAIALSLAMLEQGSGPFGAVVVKNSEIISEGANHVTATNDPTAHAEIIAIREASRALHCFDLRGCELFTSCEPCPMCLGAIYWARLDRVYFGGGAADASQAGFADSFIYAEIAKPPSSRFVPMHQLMRDQALDAFRAWEHQPNKIAY